jgi:predicted nucleic acid-binding protein
VDTSVAVALVVSDHASHGAVVEALGDRVLGLAGHAWFETYSVLTRLPGANRRRAEDVVRLLEHNFPGSRFLDERQAAALAASLPRSGVSGGAVYDALIACVAASYGLPLASRDDRARPTYLAFDVDLISLS